MVLPGLMVALRLAECQYTYYADRAAMLESANPDRYEDACAAQGVLRAVERIKAAIAEAQRQGREDRGAFR